jgi:hypothetical protein
MKLIKNSSPYLLIFLFIIVTYGCKRRCICDCEYYQDLIRLTATWSANDSVVATKTLYTQKSAMYKDFVGDSLLEFENSYPPPNFTVSRKDSIYNYDRLKDQDCDKTPKIYVCECDI